MCFGVISPPHGIPITKETSDLYPPEVRDAWKTFHKWWGEHFDGDCASRSHMTPEVQEAMHTILEAPIPGFEGATGGDSCYMVMVQNLLTD